MAAVDQTIVLQDWDFGPDITQEDETEFQVISGGTHDGVFRSTLQAMGKRLHHGTGFNICSGSTSDEVAKAATRYYAY